MDFENGEHYVSTLTFEVSCLAWFRYLILTSVQASDEGDSWFKQRRYEYIFNLGPRGEDSWRPLLMLPQPVSRVPTKIFVEWDWKNKGWGQRKGGLKLVLLRESEKVAEVQLNKEAASHNWSHHVFEMESGEFLESIQPNDTIQVDRWVGGGRGHELYVENFRIGFIGGVVLM